MYRTMVGLQASDGGIEHVGFARGRLMRTVDHKTLSYSKYSVGLHGLPLHARIQFKILTLSFKTQRGLAPKYILLM